MKTEYDINIIILTGHPWRSIKTRVLRHPLRDANNLCITVSSVLTIIHHLPGKTAFSTQDRTIVIGNHSTFEVRIYLIFMLLIYTGYLIISFVIDRRMWTTKSRGWYEINFI